MKKFNYVKNQIIEILETQNYVNYEERLEDKIKQIIADTKEACLKSLEYGGGYRDKGDIKRIMGATVK